MAIPIAFGISQCLSKNEKSFSYGDRGQNIRVHISQKRGYILAVSCVLLISLNSFVSSRWSQFVCWSIFHFLDGFKCLRSTTAALRATNVQLQVTPHPHTSYPMSATSLFSIREFVESESSGARIPHWVLEALLWSPETSGQATHSLALTLSILLRRHHGSHQRSCFGAALTALRH